MTTSKDTSVDSKPMRRIDGPGFAQFMRTPHDLRVGDQVSAILPLCGECDTYRLVVAGTIEHVLAVDDAVVELAVETGDDIDTFTAEELVGVYYMTLGAMQDFVLYGMSKNAETNCQHLGPFTSLEQLRGYASPVAVLSLACGSGECDAWTTLNSGPVTVTSKSQFALNDDTADGEDFDARILSDSHYMVIDARNIPQRSNVMCVHS